MTMPGLAHLYVREEAAVVEAARSSVGSHTITFTHRGHGHLIASGAEAPVTNEDHLSPFVQPDVKWEADDLILIAASSMVRPALDTTDRLAAKGIAADVVAPGCSTPPEN